MAIEFSDANFDTEVKQAEEVVLVDFWAPWCGPCKMQGPIVEELGKDLENETGIKVGKLNVDDNQTTAQEFAVTSIPTLLIFKGGKPVDQMVGLQSKDVLANKLKDHLKE